MLIIIIFLFIGYLLINKKQETPSNDCTKKGNVCTLNEIIDGIKYKVKVSKDKEEEFYVLSNTKDELTLISEKNLINNVDWDYTHFNTSGPTLIIDKLLELTKNWTNIPNIKKWYYEDYGNKYYKEFNSKLF